MDSDDVLGDIAWTDDCQGKKDFDGDILSLSTRYWPRGGGFHASFIVPGQPVVWEGNEARPEIKPSAHSSILLLGKELVSKEFEAETEAEVKQQVEDWARAQIEPLRDLIKERYKEEKKRYRGSDE